MEIARFELQFFRPKGPYQRFPLGLAIGLFVASVVALGAEPSTLKEVYRDQFYIGVAINRTTTIGTATHEHWFNRTPEQIESDVALVNKQFNQIVSENDMKWSLIHPRPGADGYDFGPADAFLNFGISNQMYIVGHTLIWHEQTPRWVFQGINTPNSSANRQNASREELLQRMRDHIYTVVGRYRGKVRVWDVVNEAVSDVGTNILRSSPWLEIIGPDFIAKAFQFAREADPNAILRYNDYGLEDPVKRRKCITLVKSLQAQQVPVMAIGSQTHVNVSYPTFEAEMQTLADLATLGLPIHITELDVNTAQSGQRNTSAEINNSAPTTQGGQIDEANQRLAQQYSNLFKAFLRHRDSVKMVTFWGVNDALSWRADGRPLLFDGNNQPKPAFEAVIQVNSHLPR